MIQLNLLPDVKLDYIKAQRTQRLVFSIAFLVTAASIILLVLILGLDGLQKKHLSDLNNNITAQTNQIKNKPQIGSILTVQNQLESLTALHASKPAASQLFGYLTQVTPTQVSITSFGIDFTQNTATITGAADKFSSVTTYVDNLKATTYTTAINSSNSPAFSNVVLSSFGISGGTASTPAANYTITLGFDKTIFDITQTIKLTVPQQTITRSDISQPPALFTDAPASQTTTGGGH